MTKPLAPASHPRPYATYYYQGSYSKLTSWSRIGHAGSLRGAIRAATTKLFDGAYSGAIVHGLDGEAIAWIKRTRAGISIMGVFDAPR